MISAALLGSFAVDAVLILSMDYLEDGAGIPPSFSVGM